MDLTGKHYMWISGFKAGYSVISPWLTSNSYDLWNLPFNRILDWRIANLATSRTLHVEFAPVGGLYKTVILTSLNTCLFFPFFWDRCSICLVKVTHSCKLAHTCCHVSPSSCILLILDVCFIHYHCKDLIHGMDFLQSWGCCMNFQLFCDCTNIPNAAY